MKLMSSGAPSWVAAFAARTSRNSVSDCSMRDETRKKLDVLQKGDRIPFFGVAMATIFVALFSLPWWSREDTRAVLGIARFAAPYVDTGLGQRGLSLQVELADGKLVNAGSFPLVGLRPPIAGTTIKLTERRSFTGFRSYVWAPPK